MKIQISSEKNKPGLAIIGKTIKINDLANIIVFLKDGEYTSLLIDFLQSRLPEDTFAALLDKVNNQEFSGNILEMAKQPIINPIQHHIEEQ